MIHIGIDAVEIDRFKHWQHFGPAKLKRIFSEAEIAYCSVPEKAAERFAVRFAAKEAFYKAVVPLLESPISFLAICKRCEIIKEASGLPVMLVQWASLPLKGSYVAQLSLTHTKTVAIAVILLLKQS